MSVSDRCDRWTVCSVMKNVCECSIRGIISIPVPFPCASSWRYEIDGAEAASDLEFYVCRDFFEDLCVCGVTSSRVCYSSTIS